MDNDAIAPLAARAGVRKLEELPPLSHSTQRLLELVSGEDLELNDLARAIEEIPPLAARLVGLARSAYFGARGPVHSVSDAIIRVLGLQLVKQLSIGIALSGSFESDRCPPFSADQYWGSALLTATLARALARAIPPSRAVDPDNAYLCGLLHNIGLLALVHVAPREMSRVLETANEEPGRPLAEVETEMLGLHHCEAGAWLAYRWQLPEEVTVAIERHHEADYRGAHWVPTVLVGLSARWGRQRLAGVGEPWLAPDAVRALGLKQEQVDPCLAECEERIDQLSALGEILSSRDGA